MNPKVTVAPAAYPVDLASVRLQLGLDSEDYDARLAALVAAATAHVEHWTGRSLIQRTYQGFLDWWPTDLQTGAIRNWIALPRPPAISVTSLITYDDTDAPTTFSPSAYYVDVTGPCARIVLRRGQVWPNFPSALRVANGIEVDWVAGYGPNPGDVPEAIRQAILIVIAAFNEQRGDEAAPVLTGQPMPPAAQALLAPYLIWPS